MDQRRRELERELAAGDPKAAASLLRARLRANELTEAHVTLAAELGHEAALRVASNARHSPRAFDPHDAWLRTATELGGPPLLVAFAADCAERVLPLWDRTLLGLPDVTKSDPRPRAAVAAARAWVRCPCSEHGAQAMRAAEEAHVSSTSASRALPNSDQLAQDLIWYSSQAARYAAQAAWQAELACEQSRSPELGLLRHTLHTAADGAYYAAHATAVAASAPELSKLPVSQRHTSLDERRWQALRLAAYVLGELG